MFAGEDARELGAGGTTYDRATAFARSQGAASRVVLTVNKNHELALRAYNRFCFRVRELIVTDIDGGFVMDDFLMELSVDQGA